MREADTLTHPPKEASPLIEEARHLNSSSPEKVAPNWDCSEMRPG